MKDIQKVLMVFKIFSEQLRSTENPVYPPTFVVGVSKFPIGLTIHIMYIQNADRLIYSDGEKKKEDSIVQEYMYV
jgi:hypothetical protein